MRISRESPVLHETTLGGEILSLEQGRIGVYNTAGPYSRCSIAELLHGIRAMASNELSFTWADRVFLAENGVGGWMDLTVWLPLEGGYTGMCTIDNRKAVAAAREGEILAAWHARVRR